MTEPTTDIIDAICCAIHSFRRCGMQPPTTILLGSHEEGQRFLSLVRQSDIWHMGINDAVVGKFVEMADGSIYMEVKVAGVKVRWPSSKIAMPGGRWRFV